MTGGIGKGPPNPNPLDGSTPASERTQPTSKEEQEKKELEENTTNAAHGTLGILIIPEIFT